MPDTIRDLIQPPPVHFLNPRGGQPRRPDRPLMVGSVCLPCPGTLWKLPHESGTPGTTHDRSLEWEQTGVYGFILEAGLPACDAGKVLPWEWPAVAGAKTQTPFGGESCGATPSAEACGDEAVPADRRAERASGLPAGGASHHDRKLWGASLDAVSVAVPRPEPPPEVQQLLFLDRGPCTCTRHWPRTDARPEFSSAARQDLERVMSFHPCCRVVDHAHRWLNRCRRL